MYVHARRGFLHVHRFNYHFQIPLAGSLRQRKFSWKRPYTRVRSGTLAIRDPAIRPFPRDRFASEFASELPLQGR